MRRLLPLVMLGAIGCAGSSDSAALPPVTPPPTSSGTITLSLSSAPAGAQAIRLHLVARGLSQLTPIGTTRALAQRIAGDTADLVLTLPPLGENMISFRLADRDAPIVAQVLEATAGRQFDYLSLNGSTVQLGVRRQ